VSDGGPTELPRIKARLPFAQNGAKLGAGARRTGLAIYLVLTLGLIGVAAYMGAVAGHPLTSPYVVAPVIGAAWFGLRLFMTLAPRD
jgi:hypothetical protein